MTKCDATKPCPTLERSEGLRLAIRLVVPEDAAFIYGLRSDPRYNRHLSKVVGTVEDQRAWIEAYKGRETLGTEYYYVIERRSDHVPCGLVRLYEIGADRFTWGSWILDTNKPSKAALESAILSFGVGFDLLGKNLAVLDVRRENETAYAFYKRLGMTQVGQDATDLFFEYPASRFFRDRDMHLQLIQGSSFT